MAEIGRMQAYSLKHSDWRRDDMNLTFMDFMGDAPTFLAHSLNKFYEYLKREEHVQALFGEELIAKALKLKVSRER